MISKRKITREIIGKLTDEELDELVYTKAADLHLGTFGEVFKDTEKDRLLKQIFSISVLDNGVRNGGFDSFFYNNGELAEYALEGLKVIGANEHAALCQAAMKVNQEQGNEFKDERGSNFDDLDEDYYSLQRVRIMGQTFIRENLEKFLD